MDQPHHLLSIRSVLILEISEKNGIIQYLCLFFPHSYTWDTPITDILKDFRFDDELRSKYTNLRDLLAHRLGYLSNFLALLVGFPENTTRKDFVR